MRFQDLPPDVVGGVISDQWGKIIKSDIDDLSLKVLKLEGLRSAIDQVASKRIDRARKYTHSRAGSSIDLFLPVLGSGGDIDIGIVVELTASGQMILDGVHRSIAAMEMGVREVFAWCVVPSKVVTAPCDLKSLKEVREDSNAIVVNKFERTNNPNFRPGGVLIENVKRDIIQILVGGTNYEAN